MEQWITEEQQWISREKQWLPEGSYQAVPSTAIALYGSNAVLQMDWIVSSETVASLASQPAPEQGFVLSSSTVGVRGLSLKSLGLAYSLSSDTVGTAAIHPSYNVFIPIVVDTALSANRGIAPHYALGWHLDTGFSANRGAAIVPTALLYPVQAESASSAYHPRIGWGQRIPGGLIGDEAFAPGGGRGFRLVPGISAVHALRPWHYWTVDPYQIQEVYLVTLTGDADGLEDVSIPASSLQARRRDGDPSYLQVVTHGQDLEKAAKDRANGQLIVYKGFRFQDGSIQKAEIARVDLEVVRVDEGGRSHSITLRGHRTVSTTNPNEVDLSGARERRVVAGQRRYITDVEPFLRPGDLVTVRGETFRVGYLEFSVKESEESMQVVEKEA